MPEALKNVVGFYCQEEDEQEQLLHRNIDVDTITNHICQSYKVLRFFVKQTSNDDSWLGNSGEYLLFWDSSMEKIQPCSWPFWLGVT